jgi:F0F1-type ATP synthase assembly protein I
MSIIDATEFLKKLLKETDNKRETKVYKAFIEILDNLKNRDLTEDQLLLIEDEIKILNLISNPENKKRYFSKRLVVFKQFLKDEFSLISEGYYTAIGISLGMCFGMAIGTSIGVVGSSVGLALGSTLGMIIGLIVGLVIGRNKDTEAEKNNRVLKNKFSSL